MATAHDCACDGVAEMDWGMKVKPVWRKACLRCSITHKCATSIPLLKRLACQNIHVLNLSVIAEKCAQLLISAAHRYTPNKELILRVGVSPVGNTASGVSEPHLHVRAFRGRAGVASAQGVEWV